VVSAILKSRTLLDRLESHLDNDQLQNILKTCKPKEMKENIADSEPKKMKMNEVDKKDNILELNSTQPSTTTTTTTTTTTIKNPKTLRIVKKTSIKSSVPKHDDFDIIIPEFKSIPSQQITKSKKQTFKRKENTDFGDIREGEMDNVDLEDKNIKRRSLKFHVSRVDQQIQKRQRRQFGAGDDDLPYRQKKIQDQNPLSAPPEAVDAHFVDGTQAFSDNNDDEMDDVNDLNDSFNDENMSIGSGGNDDADMLTLEDKEAMEYLNKVKKMKQTQKEEREAMAAERRELQLAEA